MLSAREAQALREAMALREATALRRLAEARPDLTPEQLAAARAAMATKAGTKRPAAKRPAGKGTAGKRSAAKRPTRTRPAARRAARAGTPAERTGSRWSSRLGVVALSTLLIPAVVTVVLPGATTPSGGPLDVTALALSARSSLLEAADGYRVLEEQAAHRRSQLEEARAAEQAAQDQVAADRRVVGAGAAALYRATPTARHPLLALDSADPSGTADVLFHQAVTEHADRALDGAVVRAERTSAALAAAAAQVAAAEAAVQAADAELDSALSAMRDQVDELSPEVTSRLAALGAIPAAGEQQERNERAVARWQGYLAQLGGAGIELPAAAKIADPAAMPSGLSPALDAAGQAVPGVAWAVIGSSPVTVLPSETVAAVSNALSQLGKPFVAGTAGPETYDCGGFTAASWLLAGYALPATPQEQWAAGAAVPLDSLQIGDLVFSPGGQDVGLYLGDGDVLGASAGTYQVGVRSIAAGSTAVRVPVQVTGGPNAPMPGTGPTGPCGAELPTPGVNSPRWGGWDNGKIPTEALCQLGVYRHALRCDAAAGYLAMATAYRAAFGTDLCITDSYRSLGGQRTAFFLKPALAAVPGTSNHGWALAVDLCGGIHVAGSPQWTWMTANAGRFGFVQPAWAAPGGEKPEPWHWEFGYIS
ncbi:NlpC/P60 family protein [Candidatus Blastococcus massiliensis]|uniref:NlpC/P60 family protein n=1 Tax=Candidatus Blastococcus massiliensis TaxID=1470358 RepID=UPI0004B8F85A|nr:NlpC/P60 family protein [Candidatus Blastococcus massiliensis]